MTFFNRLLHAFISTTLTAMPLALAPLPVFAAKVDTTLSSTRNAERAAKIARNKASVTRVKGILVCANQGEDNESCVLQIKDQDSGKIYVLKGAEEVMKVYEKGTKEVMVEGSFTEPNTLTPSRVTEL